MRNLLAATLCALLLLSGCAAGNSEVGNSDPGSVSPDADQTTVGAIAFTDVMGREITLDRRPETFIVANYIANFMMVGGADSLDKVVGMTFDGWQDTRYGEYTVFTAAFPALLEIESIGGYHDDVLDAEKILSLRPDVLLVGRSQYTENNQHIATFESAGIAVVVLDYHAMILENHTASTTILGRLLGRESVAEAQNLAYESAILDIGARLADIPEAEKHRPVYVELGNLGVGEYGNSYSDDMLWGAIVSGLEADNLAAGLADGYGALDREFVLSRNPEIIFIGGSIWSGDSAGDQMRMGFTVDEAAARARLQGFADRPEWQELDAVRSGRVYGIDHGSLRNMADYAFTMYIAKVLYPAHFADLDPQGAIDNFYAAYLPELDYTGTFLLALSE